MKTNHHAHPARERHAYQAVVAVLLLLGAAVAVYRAATDFQVNRGFENPVAFCMRGERLFVLEKERNTLLELERFTPGEPMRLLRARPIQPDDAEHYYMVRRIYPSPRGIMTAGYIYNRATKAFIGYRYQEHTGVFTAPDTLATILLANPEDAPEFYYAHDAGGSHYFVHNCAGLRNIWKLPPEGTFTIVSDRIPPEIQRLGETNALLTSWAAICVGPQSNIYISSQTEGLVLEYSPDGRRLRSIGKAGFAPNELLAPEELSWVSFSPEQPQRLTVAGSGNRTWVQFDSDGQPVARLTPLSGDYRFPDILVSTLYESTIPGRLYTFDLAHKAMVVMENGRTAALTHYETRRPVIAALWALLALTLTGLAVSRRRWLLALSRMRFPALVKLLLIFSPILVGSTLIVGDWVRDTMKADLEAEYILRAANLAHAVVNTVSIADLEAIRRPEDRESPVYERIYSTVSHIVDRAHVAGTPKWILHKIADGRFYFGINIWRGAIFEPFIVPPERRMFHEAIEKKACRWGRFTDDQGEWFSYLCPILNEKGEAIYLLELYRTTEEMNRTNRQVFVRVLRIAGITGLFAFAVLLLLCVLFTRQLRELARGAQIVSTGNFDHRIPIVSRDEMGHFAQVFNRMVIDLKSYTEDLARTTAEKERMDSELRFAREVQSGVLPRVFPPFPRAENVEIVARIEPAREIGGDYYDFFMVDDRHLGVVIADVAGKGMPAGLFLMILRTELRDHARQSLSAAETLSRVNNILAADNPSLMFATVFYLILNLDTGRIVCCNAGHPPPIRLTTSSAAYVDGELAGGSGMVIGAMENAAYTDSVFTLKPEETLLLFTDGITEAADRAGEMYGSERLLEMARAHTAVPPRDLRDRLFEDTIRFQEGQEQFDDITILLLTFHARGNRPA